MGRLVTTEEFSRETNVCQRTAERWARSGRVPRVRVGRRWLIDAEQALRSEQPAADTIRFDALRDCLARLIQPETAGVIVERVREMAGGSR